ncbi:PHP domain-containing protein [Anaerobacillus sp. MEB173]|uniref:PHP domain-containing protein n=1 Tax=Anaerobacillus sp. MEB173 TaxID=3383345 RepID=UPI003F8EFECE
MSYNADLHMHSTASDGGYTPDQLVKKCADVGLEIVALTDHDTMEGVDEAIAVGQIIGVEVIPGIEFSTKEGSTSVHMLGFGLDRHNKELQQMLHTQRDMRRKRLDVILAKLEKVDITLAPEDVLKYVDGGSIGRPHVAKALIEHGYVADVAEAFNLYLAEGKPCYVSKEKEMTPVEAIEWIHKSGGVAVLAHPIYYDLDHMIEEWVSQYQLDGVEVYHRDHDSEAVARYEKIVATIEEKYGVSLIRTGGSDFHHEDYGRVRQPLGETRIPNSLAEQVKARL